MLRIMDMARAMRDERATVERELNVEETRELLRKKLLSSTEISGDVLRPEEVDIAIDQYFASLHTYRDPPLNWAVFWAHVYVRRWGVLASLLVLTLVSIGLWRTVPSMTPAARNERQVVAAKTNVGALARSVQAEAVEPAAQERAAQLAREVEAATANNNANQLHNLEAKLLSLRQQLNEEYEVHIVSDRGRKSAIDRYFGKLNASNLTKEPAWYVIVEAHNSRGQLMTQSIRNSETGKLQSVTTWAERVPQEVYERLKADKKDGVLNETLFSVKERGYLGEQMKLRGADGKPLEKTGQLTSW
jgi:hypothetical protein